MSEQSAWEKAAKQLHDDMKMLAPKMAASMMPAPGAVAVSPERERAMWWQRAVSPEEESLVWQSIIQEGLAEGMDEAGAIARALPRVAMAVFPSRAALLNQSERKRGVPGWVEKQIAYAKRMERLGPPDQEGGDEYG